MKPKSINKVLSDASKQNFRLCYVTHKKKDQASNFGKRLVYNEVACFLIGIMKIKCLFVYTKVG